MNTNNNTCPKCGKKATVLQSNNPLVAPTCLDCISSILDYNKIEHGDFFCRTYNIEFDPELWIKMSKEFKQRIFAEYIKYIIDDKSYETNNLETWRELDKEWELVQTHEELISKIAPIKAGYMQRNQIKWGTGYTFEQLISLENLFVNTLRANNVSSPMQKDAIKKACKMSVALDKAISNMDSKEINELSKAYQNFVKTAKIDDLIQAASQDVISNVAQLVDFIEENGYEFKFYDNVDRDIVDKSLKDIQQFIRRLVSDATGLDVIFETINSAVKTEDALLKDAESYQKVPLEDLFSDAFSKMDEESYKFDEELEKQELEIDDEEEFF